MKNIKGKCALLIILTLIIGLFSSSTKAMAAPDWSFNAGNNNCIIYLAKNGYYDLTAMFKGEDAEKMTNVYDIKYTSSDSNIVFIREKTGQIRADKYGTMKTSTGEAKITCTIINKTKVNATPYIRQMYVKVGYEPVEVKISNTDIVEQALEIGKEYDLNSIMYLEDGTEFAKNAYRGWFCDGMNIGFTEGKFTPVKAGEYTITVGLFKTKADRTAGLSKAVDTDKVTVTVGSDECTITSAKLEKKDTIKLNLSAPITEIQAKKLKMYTYTGSNALNSSALIKGINLNSEGTVITVTFYSDLTDGTLYKFALEDMNIDYVFKAEIGEAVAVVFTNSDLSEAVVGVPLILQVKYVDINGIEVTPAEGTLSITCSNSTYAYFDGSNLLYVYKINEVVTVEAKYTLKNSYNSDWTNKTLIGDTINVIGVDKASIEMSDEYEFTVGDNYGSGADWINKTSYVELGSSKFLSFRAKQSDGQFNYSFKYEVINSGVVFINSATGAIVPLASGTAEILVTNENKTYAKTISITVREASKNVDIIVVPENTNVGSNAVGINDSVTFTTKYVDQYGETKDCICWVEFMGATSFDYGKIAINNGNIIVNTQGITKGTYNLKVTDGTFYKFVQVIVVQPDSNVVAYKVVAKKTAMDIVIDSDSNLADYENLFNIVGIDQNGLSVCLITAGDSISVNGVSTIVTSVQSNLKLNGSVITKGFAYSSGSSTGMFTPVYTDTSAIASVNGVTVSKLASGIYTINATVTVGGITREAVPAVITVSDTGLLSNVGISKSSITVDDDYVTSVLAIKSYITDSSNGVITLPSATLANNGYVYRTIDMEYITSISGSSGSAGYVSGDFLIKTITIATSYTNGNIDVHKYSLNNVVSVNIVD